MFGVLGIIILAMMFMSPFIFDKIADVFIFFFDLKDKMKGKK